MTRQHRRKPSTQGHAAQAIVEFATALPLFMMFVFVTIELSLVFLAYYSETRMTRQTSRWLAVHRDASNDAVAQQVLGSMLPGIVNDGTSVLVSDDNATAHYRVGGKLDVWFTSCGGTPAPCPNDQGASSRGPGSTITVSMQYDVSNMLFLPTTFRLGALTTSLPTQLPSYQVSTMAE